MKHLIQQASLTILSFFGILALAIFSVIFYLEIKHLNSEMKWVDHTEKTVKLSDEILSDYYSLESSIRAYILTNDSTYLDTFLTKKRELISKVNELSAFTEDNSTQQKYIKNLNTLLPERFASFDLTIALRKTHSLDDTLNYFLKSKSFMSRNLSISHQTNELIHKINQEEDRLLTTRNQTLTHQLNRFTNIGFFIEIGSILIIFITLTILNRQLLQRVLTEKKLQHSQVQLRKLAYYDSLTGLNNRYGLLDYLKQFTDFPLNDTHTIALLYLDLDNFKNINDTFGHEMGDELLKKIAKRLNTIPHPNKFVARISGDEFVIFITKIARNNEVALIAQYILDSITSPVWINNQQIIATASIGISTYQHGTQSTNLMLKDADIAMYKAKQLGKNNYQFCTKEMSHEFEQRSLIYHQLYQAVMNKEFIVMYQPKMSMKTNEISGMEALIRWSKPQYGIIFPNDFISLAENNGLILHIGEWMLHSVCDQIKKWQNSGIKTPHVAINVSMREFVMRDFSTVVKRILDDTELDPSFLEIEITETLLMDKASNNISAIKQLKNLGVKITIDDFGTGYSSLSYLNLLPIDKLKIDKSFVSQINMDQQHSGIIIAIISMAHTLGMKVIAEGVETKEQFEFLKKHQCDEIQGYIYSQPLSVDDAKAFLLQNKTLKFS